MASDPSTTPEYVTFPEFLLVHTLDQYMFPALFTLSILGNSLALAVFCQKQLRIQLCSRLYMTLAIVDGLAVIFHLGFRLVRIFQITREPRSDVECKLQFFFYSTFHSLSPWIIILICLFRFITVWFPLKANQMNSRRFYYGLLTLGAVIIVLCYTPLLVTARGNSAGQCYGGFPGYPLHWYSHVFFFWINLTLSCLLPAVLVLILNLGIFIGLVYYRKTLKKAQALGKHVPPLHGIAMVLVVSYLIVFVNLLTPIIWLHHQNHQTAIETREYWKDILLARIAVYMSDFNHCINILLYILAGSEFRKGLNTLLSCADNKPKCCVG